MGLIAGNPARQLHKQLVQLRLRGSDGDRTCRSGHC
jgi:hypothetical protein